MRVIPIYVCVLCISFFIVCPCRIMSQSGAPATAFALENSVAAIRSIETGLDDMSQDNQSMSPRREPRREPQPEPSAPPAPQAAERAIGEAQHAGFSLQVRPRRTICDLRDSWCRSEWQSETWTAPSLATRVGGVYDQRTMRQCARCVGLWVVIK
jgi:hypothetical protein